MQEWDEWLRHRIRAYIWKQWKKPKTKLKNLMKLGVPEMCIRDRPYLHHVQDVLAMLPGVTDVTVNARIDTALVLYGAQTTSSRQILRWVDIVVDTGLEIAKEIKPEEADEKQLEQVCLLYTSRCV